MGDRFGADNVERALRIQEGSVLANEVLRLRAVLDGTVPAEGSWRTEALALRAAVERVRALHVNDLSGRAAPAPPGMCEVCMYEWPCPTVRALDG